MSLENEIRDRLLELRKAGLYPQPGYPRPEEVPPTLEELKHYVTDSVCPATDGCDVEPDGTCPHDHVSWLLYFGLI